MVEIRRSWSAHALRILIMGMRDTARVKERFPTVRSSAQERKPLASPNEAGSGRPALAAGENGLRLCAFGEGLKKAPSQKEMAGVLRVTTRHLRRWERAEAAANRCCSRPYTHADLWHLYQRRGTKGWDRSEAAGLGLSQVFERFDQMLLGSITKRPLDDRSTLVTLMLRSIAIDEKEAVPNANAYPHAFSAGLAKAAKTQLRLIVDCDHARELLAKAFFEAALITEAKSVTKSAKSGSGGELSA